MNQNTSKAAQADVPEDFKTLMKRPRIAWPTFMLLFSAYAVFGLSSIAYIEGVLPLSWSILFNALASYMAFAMAHEASHSSVCINQSVNDWAGRAAMLLLEPGPFFVLFRFIHMQHHRFTNDPEKDPDAWCGTGPGWLLPIRWLTVDFVYFRYYLKGETFRKRPEKEKAEFIFSVLFAVAVVTTVIAVGWLEYYLLLFFIPTRVAKLVIVLAFDFLPHFPHDVTAKDNRYRATSNRVGLEWLMTPLFISQNYHLVHHLYPAVPFYRLLKIWNARRAFHTSKDPATVNTLALKPNGAKPN